MLQTISLDKKTILLKAEKEDELAQILDCVEKQNRQDKQETLDQLLTFASQHRIVDNDFKFNRDDCYIR